MAHQSTAFPMCLVLVVVAGFWAGTVMAQSSDCTNVIISMSPCLSYISGNSSTPDSGCCTQLATVVKSQPQCLCEVLNGGGSNLGLNINQTQALELPKACNVQTPSVSQCGAGSPSGSPGSSTNSPNTPGGGSKTVPSSGNGASAATSTKLATPLAFLILFVASYASNFNMF